MSYWRQKSQQVIAKAVKELPKDATPQQIKQAIDKSYPFGARANYPYKAWLSERRIALENLGLIDIKPAIKPDHVAEGQLSLF